MASESDNDDRHELLVAKCVAMACMFCATCLFGAIPFMLNYWFKWTEKGANTRHAKVVTCLLYFGGGVLLATTFVHLLPEVQEVVENLQKCDQIKKVDFAIPELLMCAGFFFMYLIEELIHSYLHRNKKKIMDKDDGVGAAFERGHSVRNSVLVKNGKKSKKQDGVDEEDQEQTDASSSSTKAVALNNHSYDNNNYQDSTDNLQIQISSSASSSTNPPECSTQPYTLQHSLEHSHTPSPDHSHNYSHAHGHDHGGHGHSHLPISPSPGDDDAIITSSLRGLGIVLALSLHEVFEGLAIGLEKETNNVWFLFAAVSAHKLVLAFCIGVELIVGRTRTFLAVLYMITFAIVSPIGTAIGIGISHNSPDAGNSILSMVLQGIACGTLLYVVFFEILNKQHAGLGAFISMLIGFALMFGLQNIGEGDSSDEDTCPGSTLVSTTTPPTTLMDMTTATTTIIT